MDTRPSFSLEHVLLVTEPGVDGVFRHVEGLADFLIAGGHTVDLAFSGRRGGLDLGALVQRIESAGGCALDLDVDNCPGVGDVRAGLRLQQLIRRRQPDVIHAHSSKAGALVRLLPWIGAAKLVYTPHAYYGLRPGSHWQGRFYNRLERLLGWRGVTINVSESEAGFAAVVLGIGSDARTTISNGVDVTHFRPPTAEERRAARAELGLTGNAKVLGCVARLCPQKDPHTLYRVLAAVREEGTHVHLVHVGTGPDTNYAQSLLTSELQPHITRIAALAPRTLYHAVDGVIVTSRYEGLSLVVLEALACGLPLILTDVPGNDDVLRRKPSYAFSFAAGDVVAGARYVRSWAAASNAHPANNHRELACRFYAAPRCYEKVLTVYRGGSVAASIPTRAQALPSVDIPSFARASCWLFLMLGLFGAAWLMLRGSGNMPGARWLPHSLVAWIDHHGRLRNVPAYLILSVPAFALAKPKQVGAVALALGALAAGLELAQLVVPTRQFDWADIWLSWLGVLIAYAYCARSRGYAKPAKIELEEIYDRRTS